MTFRSRNLSISRSLSTSLILSELTCHSLSAVILVSLPVVYKLEQAGWLATFEMVVIIYERDIFLLLGALSCASSILLHRHRSYVSFLLPWRLQGEAVP